MHFLAILFLRIVHSIQKNKTAFYRGKACIKRFFIQLYLKEYYTKIINYEIKEMIQLTCEENRSYKKPQVSHICKKKLVLMMIIKVIRSEIAVITQENKEELLMIFVI